MKKSTKRILFGLLAVILIDQIVGRVIFSSLLPDSGDSVWDSQEYAVRMWVIAGLIAFFATAVGGFIAREKFLIPAIAYITIRSAFYFYPNLSEFSQLNFEQIVVTVWPALIDVAIGAAGAFAGMKLFGLICARSPEAHIEKSPGWLAIYRYYLYFALVLIAVGMLLSIAVLFAGAFRVAVVSIAVAIFVISSLERFGEKRISNVHLIVNAATLAAAVALIGIGNDYSEPAVVIIALPFALLSVYWLWKLYQFAQSPEGSRPIGDSEIKSWKKGRKVLYVAMPSLVLALVATVIVFAPALLAEATGASAFMMFSVMYMPIGNELIFVGVVMSVYRICKILI